MIDPRFLIGGGLLAFAAGFGAGWQVQGWRSDARLYDIQTGLQAQKDALQDALNENANAFEQTRTDNITATVRDRETLKVIYRDRTISPDCALPAASISLLDQARLRANGYATGEPSKSLPANQAAN